MGNSVVTPSPTSTTTPVPLPEAYMLRRGCGAMNSAGTSIDSKKNSAMRSLCLFGVIAACDRKTYRSNDSAAGYGVLSTVETQL